MFFRFPNGIKSVADKIHALGLKVGIYSSAGSE
jgi:alpha-galactosidase